MRGLLVLVVLVGCYEPTLRECTVQCHDDADCGGGQVCGADLWCAMPGAADCEQRVEPDAPQVMPQPDASNEACLAVCPNDNCVAGVCVLDCSATGSCPEDVKCPPGVPCRVLCGDQACGHHVDCTMATACEVQCTGADSCHDEVRCGGGACTVRCDGANSCKRVKCAESCACDATCTGTNACTETSECPSTACKAGEGCTADGACNTCSG